MKEGCLNRLFEHSARPRLRRGIGRLLVTYCPPTVEPVEEDETMANLNKKNPLFPLLWAAAVNAAALSSGCTPSTTPTEPIHVIADFDTSGGFRPHLGESASLLCRLIDQLDSVDTLDCYRTDNLTAPFYQGQVPDSAEAFQPVLVKELSAKACRPGTYPAAFFQQIG